MFALWVQELFRLSDRVFSLMEEVADAGEFSVEDQDARLVALSGMQERLVGCGFWLHIYETIANKHEDENAILDYAGSNLSLDKTSNSMIYIIRLSLVVFFHFKLENLFRSLVEEILSKQMYSLPQLYKCLFPEIGVTSSEEKYEVLKAFSSIRNSLHNNGIHTHPSFSVTIKGLEYKFDQGEAVECASIDYILVMLEAIIEIVGEVLRSEKVMSVKRRIPERFADSRSIGNPL